MPTGIDDWKEFLELNEKLWNSDTGKKDAD
jgi:hypothetical protein